MAGLVNKLKEKVHRRSESSSSATASNKDDYDYSEPRATAATIPDSPSSHGHRTNPRVSVENSAFHVTSPGGVRKSLDAPQDPYQITYANSNASNQPRRIVSLGNHEAIPGQHATEKEPGRHRLPPVKGGSHNKSASRAEQQASVSDMVPGRKSSKNTATDSPGRHDHSDPHTRGSVPARKPLNDAWTSDHRKQSGADINQHHDGVASETGSRQHVEPASTIRAVIGHETRGELSTSVSAGLVHPTRQNPLPPNDISHQTTTHNSRGMNTEEQTSRKASAKPLPRLPSTGEGGDGHLAFDALVAEEYLSTDRERHMAENEKARAINSGHLNLPSGFNLQNTEETHVTEEQRPAVTHETIIKQRTEIVQEEITRDIHVHHYYTYLQPVRVVEVLPARHYFLDLQTGIKTEVLPPADYQMPLSMTPISPDTSMVKATTRHYLVDEEHPTGVLEPPPLKHEQGHEDLRQQAVA